MIHNKKWAIKVGTKIEMEHTKSKKFAAKIAGDHIRELGPKYYSELIKMEKKLAKQQRRK